MRGTKGETDCAGGVRRVLCLMTRLESDMTKPDRVIPKLLSYIILHLRDGEWVVETFDDLSTALKGFSIKTPAAKVLAEVIKENS